MAKSLILSATYLQQLLNCPYSVYLSRVHRPDNFIVYIDYPALLGQAVHSFIKYLYNGNHPDRAFYYKTPESAKKGWFAWWNRIHDNPPKPIKCPSTEKKYQWGGVGWGCILNYWNQNIGKSKPDEIELRLKFHTGYPGVYFTGVFDQLRRVSIELISQFNPEIVAGGNLHHNYRPYVIVDLKTSAGSYDISRYKPNATYLEMTEAQAKLHRDIQACAYYWLFSKWRGGLPAGFFIYHLRSGKYFFTSRDALDFMTLFNQIEHTINLLNTGIFPQNPSNLCRYCDVLHYCGQGAARYSKPADELTSVSISPLPVCIRDNTPKQLKFKLR